MTVQSAAELREDRLALVEHERVGVTERAAQRIVSDLVQTGYLDRLREGRRNSYRIKGDRPLRHPVERGHRIGEILEVLHEHQEVG